MNRFPEEDDPMADGRFLSKTLSVSAQFADLANNDHRLVFLMAIPHLDRDGRIGADPRQLRALACPMLDLSVDTVKSAIADFVTLGMVVSYTDGEGACVLEFTGFTRSQKGMRYDRETPSRYGPHPEASGEHPEASGRREEKRREVEEKSSEATRARPRNGAPDPGPIREDPSLLRLIEELEAHPILGLVSVRQTAELILGKLMHNGKPLEWHLDAIRRTAATAEGALAAGHPMLPAHIGQYLIKACLNPMKPHEDRPDAAAASGGAPYHREFTPEQAAEDERQRLESRKRGAAEQAKLARIKREEAPPLTDVENMTNAGNAVQQVLAAARGKR